MYRHRIGNEKRCLETLHLVVFLKGWQPGHRLLPAIFIQVGRVRDGDAYLLGEITNKPHDWRIRIVLLGRTEAPESLHLG